MMPRKVFSALAGFSSFPCFSFRAPAAFIRRITTVLEWSAALTGLHPTLAVRIAEFAGIASFATGLAKFSQPAAAGSAHRGPVGGFRASGG